MFNKDITIINKRLNKTTKMNEYHVHHVKGFWSSSKAISINDTMLVNNNSTIVRILMSEEGYITPLEFKLGLDGWTLRNDDYVVKGIVDNVKSVDKLKDMYECFKITNVSVKDYGSLDMQHYEITGE